MLRVSGSDFGHGDDCRGRGAIRRSRSGPRQPAPRPKSEPNTEHRPTPSHERPFSGQLPADRISGRPGTLPVIDILQGATAMTHPMYHVLDTGRGRSGHTHARMPPAPNGSASSSFGPLNVPGWSPVVSRWCPGAITTGTCRGGGRACAAGASTPCRAVAPRFGAAVASRCRCAVTAPAPRWGAAIAARRAAPLLLLPAALPAAVALRRACATSIAGRASSPNCGSPNQSMSKFAASARA